MNQQNNSMNNLFKNSLFSQTPQKEKKPSVFSSTPNTNPFSLTNNQQYNPLGQQTSSNIFSSNMTPALAHSNPLPFQPQNQQVPNNNAFSNVQPSTNFMGNTFGTNQNKTFGFQNQNAFLNTNQSSNPFGAVDTNKNTQTWNAGSTFGNNALATSVMPQTNVNSNQVSGSVGINSNPLNNTTSLFGKPQGIGSIFGSTALPSQPSASKTGTRNPPFESQRIKDDKSLGFCDFKHINAMKDYSEKSCEELRCEDYNLGRKAVVGSQPLNNQMFNANQNILPQSFGQQNIFKPETSTPVTQSFGALQPSSIQSNVFSSTPTSNTAFSPFASANAGPTISSVNNAGTTPSTQGFSWANTNAQKTGSVFQPSSGSTATTTQQFPSFNPTAPAVQPQSNTTSSFGNIFSQSVPSTTTSGNAFNTADRPTSTNLFESISKQPISSNQAPNNIFTPQPNISSFNQPSNSTFSSQPSFLQNQSLFNTTNLPSIQPSNFQNTASQPVPFVINNADPFNLKNIKFERIEKDKLPINRMVSKPIFNDEKKKHLVKLTYRPPKPIVRKKIYTEPSIEDIRHLYEVENLIVGFDGKGRIQYKDPIATEEISTKNFEDKILFTKNNVIINDPPGVGLNKRARVYLEGVYAYSKSEGDFIVGKATRFPLKGIQERFVYGLKADPYKKFIDYNYDTGLYVYEVNHF